MTTKYEGLPLRECHEKMNRFYWTIWVDRHSKKASDKNDYEANT